MYRIIGLLNRQDNVLGGHGFAIVLSAEHKKAVEKCSIDQNAVNQWIQNCGRHALVSSGFRVSDTDGYFTGIRVSWGEWGIEHISVPGNACGLDIDDYSKGMYPCGKGEIALSPHNVDSLHQKLALLTIFCTISDYIY